MILIVTNKQDLTADFLILELKRGGIPFVRFYTEDFPTNIQLSFSIQADSAHGFIELPNQTLRIEQIKSIWYRRPKPATLGKSIQEVTAKEFVIVESHETLMGLWRILACKWISHPDKLLAAESKIYQLQLAQLIGFNVPKTLITTSPEESLAFFYHNNQEIVYKPLRHSQLDAGDTIELIYTNKITPTQVEHFNKIRLSPVLLQQYINKSIELRITIVGSKVFATALYSQEIEDAQHDWRRVNAIDIRHEPYQLPQTVSQMCVKLVKMMGLYFGAIDMILTPDGNYYFLEINPNGQWAWIQQICPELDIRAALIEELVS